MDNVDLVISTKNKVKGKVETKQKIDTNIYPRGPKGDRGLQGEKGDTGNGIVSVEKTKTEDLVDTYTITFSNGSTFDFTVTNASTENAYTKNETEQLLNKKVNILDIINSLDSEEVNKPLSAYQGKILKQLIEANYTTDEIDELLNVVKTNMNNNITDAYSSSKTYAVGDYCINNNILYKCKIAIATGEEFDSSKWEQTNIAKELSSRLEFEVVEEW